MDVAGPNDWGLFGPDSVTWRVHAHPVMLVGGLRALLVQALHPHAMAGVAEHSDYEDDSETRLRRTSEYVTTVTYGDTEAAEAAGSLVRRVHTFVNGVDPVTGQRYSAEDADVLLWVHCVEVHSFFAAYRTYGGRLDGDEQDRYLAENVRAAELVGIPAERVPASRAEYRDYFASVEPRLCVSAATRRTMEFILTPPSSPALLPLRPVWRLVAGAAVGLMPRRLRRLYGLAWPRAVDALTYLGMKAPTASLNAALRVVPSDPLLARARWQVARHPFTAEQPRKLVEVS